MKLTEILNEANYKRLPWESRFRPIQQEKPTHEFKVGDRVSFQDKTRQRKGTVEKIDGDNVIVNRDNIYHPDKDKGKYKPEHLKKIGEDAK